jgi:hypothetical protein
MIGHGRETPRLSRNAKQKPTAAQKSGKQKITTGLREFWSALGFMSLALTESQITSRIARDLTAWNERFARSSRTMRTARLAVRTSEPNVEATIPHRARE